VFLGESGSRQVRTLAVSEPSSLTSLKGDCPGRDSPYLFPYAFAGYVLKNSTVCASSKKCSARRHFNDAIPYPSDRQRMKATLLAAAEWRQSSVHSFFTRRIDNGDHGHGNAQAEPRKFRDFGV
jgi:hypothetical protein